MGGFNANTPSTPGHVFQVTCTANCATFTWANKTGNLPDIPVDSIIVNHNIPQQVFAGTDWGVYYTDDITVASPTWFRFENGLPHAMVWDLQIDRGATTSRPGREAAAPTCGRCRATGRRHRHHLPAATTSATTASAATTATATSTTAASRPTTSAAGAHAGSAGRALCSVGRIRRVRSRRVGRAGSRRARGRAWSERAWRQVNLVVGKR